MSEFEYVIFSTYLVGGMNGGEAVGPQKPTFL